MITSLTTAQLICPTPKGHIFQLSAECWVITCRIGWILLHIQDTDWDEAIHQALDKETVDHCVEFKTDKGQTRVMLVINLLVVVKKKWNFKWVIMSDFQSLRYVF